ncbi:MAG: RlmI/RlmK family 23S rRNA methyltransferase [Firmicutes bacterium HGW-Firmicutes-1]|jgi:23S rRNA (cytosine1962-C5)-methyltransferase|nr:MAG: RlmI/RlmK family 23S rRNA methyltransferase [Firmicutes bacterium HGW-Firmicutes-1]
MKNEVDLNIKSKHIKKYKMGYPLISKEAIIDFEKVGEEGTLVNLFAENKKFIGKGYYGKQNKGAGWILSREENEKIDQIFFENRIKSAIDRRKRYYNDTDTTAFRVFNGEGDGIGGLTIDYFDGYYLINWYSKGIYEFKDDILNSLYKLVEYKAVYQKKRFDDEGKYIEEDDFVSGKRAEFPIIVKENGVKFSIYLNDGPMVGVFLDQREVRKKLRDKYAKGKSVLNTFSYTGAFSVFAALGGAYKTTSVDLANRSLSKTRENFIINGIDCEAQDIIVEDVFHYFKYAIKKNLKFDIVILDPPSFARSKKHTFSVTKDYVGLLKEAIEITEDNGIMIASTNCSNFDIDMFKVFIDKAFKEINEKYEIVEEFSLPEDFRGIKEFKEGNYLKVVFIKK